MADYPSLTRRESLRMLGLMGASTFLSCSSFSRKKPNILLIECDSMDGRIMGNMGHPAAYTPNLDRLARKGVLFKNNYCNSPQCVPSRSSMFSGLQTHHCEGWNNFKGLEQGNTTFLTELQNNGYLTQTFGKTDYLSGHHSVGARVFSWTRSANIHLPQAKKPVANLNNNYNRKVHQKDWLTVDFCKKWLSDKGGGEKPFLLYCGIRQPHPEFRTSKYWLDKIDPSLVTVPPKDKEPHPVMQYMQDTKNCSHDFSDQEIIDIRRTYFAMIAEVDAMVGELLDELDRLNLTESTVVIFTSDHGDMGMEHNQYLKNALYEPSVRVPLIIAGPTIQNSVTYEGLTSLVDIYPTLLDLAGTEPSQNLDGHSLYRILRGKNSNHPDWVLSQYHSNFQNTSSYMLRQGNWKYIVYDGFEPQLFNLKKDPYEINNLTAQRPEIVKKLDQQLLQIVDYKRVTRKVLEYDKRSFKEWFNDQGGKGWEQMAKLYQNSWSKSSQNKLSKWLKE